MHRTRTTAGRVGLIMAALVVALLLAEVGLRISGYSPLSGHHSGGQHVREVDDAREIALVPGYTGVFADVEVTYNALGYRGRSHGTAPRRVVVLGDSIAYGLYLRYEQTFGAQLDQRLGETDVFTLAVFGWDTVNEVAALEIDGLDLEPDVVVLQVCLNDSHIAAPVLEYMELRSTFRGPLIGRSLLAQALVARWYASRLEHTAAWLDEPEVYGARYASSIVAVDDHPWIDRVQREHGDGGIWERGWAKRQRVGHFRFGLERLRALAETHGFEVLVLIVPHLDGERGEPYGFEAIHELIRFEAERLGFRVVDPTSAFVAAGPSELRVLPGDPVHPDERGHALLATALEEGLSVD